MEDVLRERNQLADQLRIQRDEIEGLRKELHRVTASEDREEIIRQVEEIRLMDRAPWILAHQERMRKDVG